MEIRELQSGECPAIDSGAFSSRRYSIGDLARSNSKRATD
jgi:hypothetical protein